MFKIRDKKSGKEWGVLYNLQDAENAKFHLEDKGYDYDCLEIIEIKGGNDA